MGTRPKPTKNLVKRVLGEERRFVELVHHGLADIPSLRHFYKALNLNDLLVFAAVSRHLRETDENVDDLYVDSAVYELFEAVNATELAGLNGFQWLNRIKDSSYKSGDSEYDAQNPFRKKDLRERLEAVGTPETEELFKREFMEVPVIYTFEGPFNKEKSKQTGRIVMPMRFQPVWPRKGQGPKILDNYVKEISKILRSYPIELLDTPPPTSSPQLGLF